MLRSLSFVHMTQRSPRTQSISPAYVRISSILRSESGEMLGNPYEACISFSLSFFISLFSFFHFILIRADADRGFRVDLLAGFFTGHMQPDGKINSAPLGHHSYKRDKTDGWNGLEAKGTSREMCKSQAAWKKKERSTMRTDSSSSYSMSSLTLKERKFSFVYEMIWRSQNFFTW